MWLCHGGGFALAPCPGHYSEDTTRGLLLLTHVIEYGASLAPYSAHTMLFIIIKQES